MNFKQQINSLGLKQSFLAEKLNISPQELCMYLNKNRKMPENILSQLSDLLKKYR
jgi:hypothetical protein